MIFIQAFGLLMGGAVLGYCVHAIFVVSRDNDRLEENLDLSNEVHALRRLEAQRQKQIETYRETISSLKIQIDQLTAEVSNHGRSDVA